MSRNKKLRVIGLLNASGLAIAFSLYRLVLVLKGGQSVDQSIVFICIILSGYITNLLSHYERILTPFSNVERGVGLIYTYLLVLNVLFAHYKREYSSQKYYALGSDTRLGNQSEGSKAASRWENALTQGDESHLVSFADTPATNELVHNDDGICKTVAVSQTVESVDTDNH